MNTQTETIEIPSSQITEAICNVMSRVSRLEKTEHNTFGKYAFTSVDDFKDHVRPLLVEFGLSVHVTQSDFKMLEYTDGKANKSAAQFDFQMTLSHKSGEKAEPENMTVVLPFTGAQTSGAARSYALKEWIKSRFLASAGDQKEEADLLDNSNAGLRLSKAGARDLDKELRQEMQKVIDKRDHKELGEWWTGNRHRIDTLPQDWFLMLKNEYIDQWNILKANEDLDKKSNAELDEMAMEQG